MLRPANGLVDDPTGCHQDGESAENTLSFVVTAAYTHSEPTPLT
jgi:hypothetical protein